MKKIIFKNIAVVAIAILTTFGAVSCKKSSSSGNNCTCTNGYSVPVADNGSSTKQQQCTIFENAQKTGNPSVTCTVK